MKALIDEYHKVCIRESLKGVRLDWHPLKVALEEYQKGKGDESKAALEKEQANMRKQIAAAIKDFRHYKELTAPTPQKLLDNEFPDIFKNNSLLFSIKFICFNSYS